MKQLKIVLAFLSMVSVFWVMSSRQGTLAASIDDAPATANTTRLMYSLAQYKDDAGNNVTWSLDSKYNVISTYHGVTLNESFSITNGTSNAITETFLLSDDAANYLKPIYFSNQAGEDVTNQLETDFVYKSGKSGGTVDDYRRANEARVTVTVPAKKMINLNVALKTSVPNLGDGTTPLSLQTKVASTGKSLDGANMLFLWVLKVVPSRTISNIPVVGIDQFGNTVVTDNNKVSATLVSSNVVKSADDTQSYETVYRINRDDILKYGVLNPKYSVTNADAIPKSLYVYVRQYTISATQNYGVIVSDQPTSIDSVGTKVGDMTLYKYGVSLDNYDNVTNNTFATTGIGKYPNSLIAQTMNGPAYGAVAIGLTQGAVTGEFDFVDKAGQLIGTQQFGAQMPNTTTTVGEFLPTIVAPDKYKIVNPKQVLKFNAETDPKIKVLVQRVTDTAYVSPAQAIDEETGLPNLNSDGSGKSAGELTTSDAGLLANGLRLVSVPNFSSKVLTIPKNNQVVLTPDRDGVANNGSFEYTNMSGSSFSIRMAVSQMYRYVNGAKTGQPLTFKSMKVNGHEVYSGTNPDGGVVAAMEYGTTVATVSDSDATKTYDPDDLVNGNDSAYYQTTSSDTVGNMTATLDHGPKAGSYHGVVTYMAVEDDLN